MFENSWRIRNFVLLCVVVSASSALAQMNPLTTIPVDRDLMNDVQTQMREACPKAWEGYYTTITHDPNADVWQGDLSDKAEFVKYANYYLRDSDGSFRINSFDDKKAIMWACAGLKIWYSELAEEESSYLVLNGAADNDGDGVVNAIDICANTVFDVSLDMVGCTHSQRDDDGDGVPNGQELPECQGTVQAEWGDVNAQGCGASQRDTDNDGLTDDVDQCDFTATGNIGAINAEGCAPDDIDTDGDGQADYLDAYPLQSSSSTQCTP